MRRFVGIVIRVVVPLLLIAVLIVPPASPGPVRVGAAALLLGYWTLIYARYRRAGKQRTNREYGFLARTSWTAFWRHYNERVPTVEEEFEIWGPYHEHRHMLRYDLVAADAQAHLPDGGTMLDLGCGSAMVADRLQSRPFTYVGMDFGGPHIVYAKKKYSGHDVRAMRTGFVRGDGEKLPFADATFDVVVMSEVIEHLLRPDVAVWEISRVLKPGGIFVMTTNNASEVPCRSPLSHLFAWLEKGLGAYRPGLISLRPWVWPQQVDRDLLPEGSDDVYLPHTHHIYAETRKMFAAAGLDNVSWKTFEFPPPQSQLAAWFEKRGNLGIRLVDILEAIAIKTPFVRRLGCHIFIVSRKAREPQTAEPQAVWPGPLSA